MLENTQLHLSIEINATTKQTEVAFIMDADGGLEGNNYREKLLLETFVWDNKYPLHSLQSLLITPTNKGVNPMQRLFILTDEYLPRIGEGGVLFLKNMISYFQYDGCKNMETVSTEGIRFKIFVREFK